TRDRREPGRVVQRPRRSPDSRRSGLSDRWQVFKSPLSPLDVVSAHPECRRTTGGPCRVRLTTFAMAAVVRTGQHKALSSAEREIEMSPSSPTSLVDVDVQPGKVPMLRVEPAGEAARWVAEHLDTLRASVVKHGALLVRGLGLRDIAETEAVFRRLGGLMT